MSFYVKKLYSNELGWRGGKPNKAGKFLFVSKKENVINFFPTHNSDEIDPSMSLGIIVHDMKRLVNANIFITATNYQNIRVKIEEFI